ncbi:hypothetical protein B7P43_G07056 [Cryptotermes secundus]|uniref:Uncharacterized protein n=1 Tax=Cryptotermes secundus TaxID=105785 RepID=A0A2J7QLD7_9NEOP|nr:hypothetical protein B7P43_G07056 [Cryptotermes secundus]
MPQVTYCSFCPNPPLLLYDLFTHRTMYVLMCLQKILPTELTILITAKWSLLSMYTLMCLQVTLQTERLTTHVTAKRSLPIMYAVVFLQITLITE